MKHGFFILFVFICSACTVVLPAQSNRSNADTARYLRSRALIIPVTFIAYGGLKAFVQGIATIDDNVYNNIEKHYATFHTNAADYLMWLPSASVYAMDALKVQTEHTFKQHILLDAGSVIVTGALGYSMRIISRNINVYNVHGTKFPSGHTANAFRGAELLHQELKYSHPALSYSGFIVATGVGLLRLYNKDHLFSEVLTGAGLGILSSKITYFVFGKIKRRSTRQ